MVESTRFDRECVVFIVRINNRFGGSSSTATKQEPYTNRRALKGIAVMS